MKHVFALITHSYARDSINRLADKLADIVVDDLSDGMLGLFLYCQCLDNPVLAKPTDCATNAAPSRMLNAGKACLQVPSSSLSPLRVHPTTVFRKMDSDAIKAWFRERVGTSRPPSTVFGSVDNKTLETWFRARQGASGLSPWRLGPYRKLLLFSDVLDTRGENQPYLILAVEAAHRYRETHDVLLVIRKSFETVVRSVLEAFRTDNTSASFDNLKVLVSQAEDQVFADPEKNVESLNNMDKIYAQLSEMRFMAKNSEANSLHDVLRWRVAKQKFCDTAVAAATEMRELIAPLALKAYGGVSNVIHTGLQAMDCLEAYCNEIKCPAGFQPYPMSMVENCVLRGIQQVYHEAMEKDLCTRSRGARLRANRVFSISRSLSPRIRAVSDPKFPIIGPILTASPRFEPIYRDLMPAVYDMKNSANSSVATLVLDHLTMVSETTRDWILQEKFTDGRKLICVAISSMSLTRLLSWEIEALASRSQHEGWSFLIVHRDAESVVQAIGESAAAQMRLLGSPNEPFEYLFPFFDTIVTHGGTTRYQAVASLVPMVLLSYGVADQDEVNEDFENLGLGKRLPETYFDEKREAQAVLANTIADVLEKSRSHHLPALENLRVQLLTEAESAVNSTLDFIVLGKPVT